MRRNSDDAIRELARRVYEGETSLIPVLARLYERSGGEGADEVWLVERWGNDNDRGEADRWVLSSYEDATAFVAVLMLDEMDTEIGEMDSIDGWMSHDRERAWKEGLETARAAFTRDNCVGVIEAWENIGTDLVHYARNGVAFVSRPLGGSAL